MGLMSSLSTFLMIASITGWTSAQAESEKKSAVQGQPASSKAFGSPTGGFTEKEWGLLLADKAALDALLNVLNANRLSPLYVGPPTACAVGDTDCKVVLVPREFYDGNDLVGCTIQVGQIDLNMPLVLPINKKTTVHWTIGPPAAHNPPSNAVYTFETRGLIIFKDEDNATLKKADSVSDTDMKLTHRFMPKQRDVIYYPLVFQKVGSAAPTLCGSADPKIVSH